MADVSGIILGKLFEFLLCFNNLIDYYVLSNYLACLKKKWHV